MIPGAGSRAPRVISRKQPTNNYVGTQQCCVPTESKIKIFPENLLSCSGYSLGVRGFVAQNLVFQG